MQTRLNQRHTSDRGHNLKIKDSVFIPLERTAIKGTRFSEESSIRERHGQVSDQKTIDRISRALGSSEKQGLVDSLQLPL